MLGFAYVKLAQNIGAPSEEQEPVTPWQATMRAHQAGQYAQQPNPYGNMPLSTGVSSWQQMAPMLLGQIDEDSGAMLQLAMPFLKKILPPNIVANLEAPRRISIGVGSTPHAQQVMAVAQQANMAAMAQHGQEMQQVLRNIQQQAVGADNSLVQQASPFIGWIADQAANNPAMVGGVVAQLRAAKIPMLSDILDVSFRHIPTSYMPLVQAAYNEHAGAIDGTKMQALLKEYNDAYRSGAFVNERGEPLDANMSMNGFGLAAQAFGNQRTLKQSLEFTQVANLLMEKYRLVKTPNEAFLFIQGMGPHQVLQNIPEFERKLHQLQTKFSAAGIQDPAGHMRMALEQSMKSGVPLDRVVSSIADNAARDRTWTLAGYSPEQRASMQGLQQAGEAARTQGFAKADTTKGVTAFMMESERGNQMAQDFFADPTPEKAAVLMSAARSSPSWKNRDAYNPDVLQQYMGNDQWRAFAFGEQLNMAKQLSPQLTGILRNPEQYEELFRDPLSAPAEQRAALAKMPYYAKEFISNPARRNAVLSHLDAQSFNDNLMSTYKEPFKASPGVVEKLKARPPQPMVPEQEPIKPITPELPNTNVRPNPA